MLTGQGLIGKLVYFLASKLIGKQLDLALNDKKRACRAFVELYYCVERLEDITGHFIEALDEVQHSEDTWILVNQFALHGPSLDAVSRRFIDIGTELNRAVQLYNEDLADAVDQLYRFKYSFLLFMADSLEIMDKDGERNRLLKYIEPSPRVLHIDMEGYYQWIKESRDKHLTDQVTLDWPQNMLTYSAFGEHFRENIIEIADVEAVKHFLRVLKDHGAVLTVAREKLRKFIVENFSIEDVLYVSKSLPHEEF